MFPCPKLSSLVTALVALIATLNPVPLEADSYYVDFANGDNLADGQSPESAWKHAPFDPEAFGIPADTVLGPGDVLRFKGGVAYHGSLVIKHSGSREAPIVLDGNRDGSWGDGPAVLDGGRVIEDWSPRRRETA